MQVDFYQLTQSTAEQVVVLLAANTLAAGQRLLVVHADPAARERLGQALWSAPAAKGAERFLANGEAGGAHDGRQPILLSDAVEPANGARFVALADGVWREAEGAERVFLVFGEATIDDARACWRMLGERAGLTRNYWKQEDGRWVKAA
ncbi:DNA polymerase III subunit chi [Novosphingobium flavum]|uniref:DNA polymerase III subunit chi n=1 Tax=Novosphingobium flavum TaxID=1778672 RepID=A0A7X1KMH0_9SPHN|nr:DNA polymerase III subunit chi [Novosphingobium flavum]MBC2666614.1 DNA polymerase III subunit chi [Novosphingobium flavum]